MENGALWHFVGLLLMAFTTALNNRVGQYGTLPMIVYKLPATMLHEFAHLVVGLITGAHPSGLSIIPRREENGDDRQWRLGSVTLRDPFPFSCLPTALAPLLHVPLAYLVFRGWPVWFPATPGYIVGMYLTIALMLASSIPSGADIRIAFSSLWGNLFYLIITASIIIYIFIQSH